MKYTAAALTCLLAQTVSAQTSCFATNNFKINIVDGECSYDDLIEGLEIRIENKNCENDAQEELRLLLGASSNGEAKDIIEEYCAEQFALQVENSKHLTDYLMKKTDFIEEYFHGGTTWNEEIQYTDESGIDRNVLANDASRVNSLYNGRGQNGMILMPEYDGLGNCNNNAIYCCWPQDRQANDNNGNCDTPYETDCVDKDPGDNTDLCAVDIDSNSEYAAHVAGGFSIFPDNKEGPIHCHGFAWSKSDDAAMTRYKANNLFYVSMYDHMYTRGYVRAVPGAPMCGCAEDMPIVSRADCTEMDIEETWRFHHVAGVGFSVSLRDVDIAYNACQGANNNNNDLEAYIERLVDEGEFKENHFERIKQNIVGDGNCDAAIANLLAEKGYA